MANVGSSKSLVIVDKLTYDVWLTPEATGKVKMWERISVWLTPGAP